MIGNQVNRHQNSKESFNANSDDRKIDPIRSGENAQKLRKVTDQILMRLKHIGSVYSSLNARIEADEYRAPLSLMPLTRRCKKIQLTVRATIGKVIKYTEACLKPYFGIGNPSYAAQNKSDLKRWLDVAKSKNKDISPMRAEWQGSSREQDAAVLYKSKKERDELEQSIQVAQNQLNLVIEGAFRDDLSEKRSVNDQLPLDKTLGAAYDHLIQLEQELIHFDEQLKPLAKWHADEKLERRYS